MEHAPARPSTVARGQMAEHMALAYLQAHGYQPIARNFRAAGGEIDIVAVQGQTLCFVEVRARHSIACGTPLETIDAGKQLRLRRAAAAFAEQLPRPWPPMRFDALGIVLVEPPQMELVRNAFGEA